MRSRSRRPTRVVGDVASRERANCTVDDDFPTPPTIVMVHQQQTSTFELIRPILPFPEMTTMMFLTLFSRRDTGVSIAAMVYKLSVFVCSIYCIAAPTCTII